MDEEKEAKTSSIPLLILLLFIVCGLVAMGVAIGFEMDKPIPDHKTVGRRTDIYYSGDNARFCENIEDAIQSGVNKLTFLEGVYPDCFGIMDGLLTVEKPTLFEYDSSSDEWTPVE